MDQIAEVEDLFPTFDDCFLLTNMSHQDVFKKAFANACGKVRLNSEVIEVDYEKARNEGKVCIKLAGGGPLKKADFVIVTSSVRIL